MFPEYVEKYNQQQAEQAQSEVSPSPTREDDSSPPKSDNQENMAKANAPKDEMNNRRQSVPTWMLLLLVSIFGLVMALPLLQP